MLSGNDGSSSTGETESYEPRNILLTGGAGFIGSHVVLRLVQRYPQYKVVVLDKLDYCATMNNLRSCQNKPNFKVPESFAFNSLYMCCQFVLGDIQSADLVRFILVSEEIDTIMHFAAQTHVDNSFGNSLAFTMNNTYGTHVLLETSRNYGKIKRFINVSTDEVYGESSYGRDSGLTEHTTLEPTNPYSAAKAGAEMLVKAYMNSYKLPCIISRGNNVYGPHQFPEKLIPKFIILASRGQNLPVHGDGLCTRSYLYVEDVAEAYDVILHHGITGETYNIGTQKEQTILQVAEKISEKFGIGKDKVVHVDDRAFNDRRYFICDKKLAALGWHERTSFEDGLGKTIDWYLKNGSKSFWDNGDADAALDPHPTLKSVGYNFT